MRSNNEKAPISLQAGSGLWIPNSLGKEYVMKTITSNTERQSLSRLTAMQRQVLAYFNSMNDEAQRDVIGMVASIAQGSPRQRPQLRVMAGGAA